MQNYSSAESSKQHINKGKEENSETLKEKDDMWKPLNCLVEACSGTKSNKLNLQGSLAKSTPSHVDDKEAHVPKAKLKERGKLKFQDEENGTTHVPSGSVKPRIRGGRQKKAATLEGFSIPALAENDGNSKCNIRACPVWFSLVASDNQWDSVSWHFEELILSLSSSYHYHVLIVWLHDNVFQGRWCTLATDTFKLLEDEVSSFSLLIHVFVLKKKISWLNFSSPNFLGFDRNTIAVWDISRFFNMFYRYSSLYWCLISSHLYVVCTYICIHTHIQHLFPANYYVADFDTWACFQFWFSFHTFQTLSDTSNLPNVSISIHSLVLFFCLDN